jgi:YegS/Rv2252/BmrU family lipid kinase
MRQAPKAARRTPPRLLIILNRRAAQRRLDRFEAVLRLLSDAGCDYHIRETQAAGDAARFAAEADPATVDAIVIAGGDGTINDAINGFLPQSPPLGLIPLGTANVLAHEIGLKAEPHAIAAALIGGQPVPVVPGQINGHRFMMMASIGFDAHVVSGVSRSLKQRIGKIVYAFEALRQLVRYPCPHLDVQIDGQAVTAATLVVSRGRLYGGRFLMAPQADLAKPELFVSVFRRKGRLAMAGYSVALPLGLLNRWKLISHRSAQRLTVSGRAGDPVQADGDVTGCLPAEVGLADFPVRVLTPDAQGALVAGW